MMIASSNSNFLDLPHHLTTWADIDADFPFLGGNSGARSWDLPYNKDGKPMNHNNSDVVQGPGPLNATVIGVHTDNFTKQTTHELQASDDEQDSRN